MAGSLGEAYQQIMSVQPGALRTLATQAREAGTKSATAGRTLSSTADEVGGQTGEIYSTWRGRLAPVAQWLTAFHGPSTTTAASLDNAAVAAEQAQSRAGQLVNALANYELSHSGPESAAAGQAAEAQVLGEMNVLIEQMSSAFAGVTPPSPGTAPVRNGGGGGGATGTGAGGGTGGGAAGGTAAGTTGTGASTAAGGAVAGAGAAGGAAAAGAGAGNGGVAAGAGGAGGAAGDGPGSDAATAGWVRDPTTGNFIDPATGREIDAAGRFIDPVTGQPFGDPAPFSSRLEGLPGGVGGLLGSGAGAFVAPAAGLAGAGALGAGGLGGVAGPGGVGALTGVGGLGGVAGFAGGAGGFAGMFGGVLPPSMLATGAAAGQARVRAEAGLQQRAAYAQKMVQLSGEEPAQQRGYIPPMGGAGGGGAGTGRSGRGGRGRVAEPAGVWGATGRGNRSGRRCPSSGATQVVEDAGVWTGGEGPAATGLLDR